MRDHTSKKTQIILRFVSLNNMKVMTGQDSRDDQGYFFVSLFQIACNCGCTSWAFCKKRLKDWATKEQFFHI